MSAAWDTVTLINTTHSNVYKNMSHPMFHFAGANIASQHLRMRLVPTSVASATRNLIKVAAAQETSTAFANNGGFMQITVADGAVYSATAGDLTSEVFVVPTGGSLAERYHQVTAIVGNNITLSAAYDASVTAVDLHLETSGFISGGGHQELSDKHVNIYADPIDQADTSAGFRVYMHLATNIDPNDEYYVQITQIGDTVLATPLETSQAFSVRASINLAFNFALDGTTYSSVASGSSITHYLHINEDSLRGTNSATRTDGYTIGSFTASGGTTSGSDATTTAGYQIYIQHPNDDQLDLLQVDTPDGNGQGELYMLSTVNEYDLQRNYATLDDVTIVVMDHFGRVANYVITIALRALPLMTVTLNPTKVGDYASTPAYDDPNDAIPLARVGLDAARYGALTSGPGGSIGSFAWAGTDAGDNFEINPTYSATSVADTFTFTMGAGVGGRTTSGAARYLQVGDKLKVNGEGLTNEQCEITVISGATITFTRDDGATGGANDFTGSGAVTVTLGDATTGVCYIALSSSAAHSNSTAYDSVQADLTYTEGVAGKMYVWNVFTELISDGSTAQGVDGYNSHSADQAALSAYKYSALVAADFATAWVDNTTYAFRDDTANSRYEVTEAQVDASALTFTVTVAAGRGIGTMTLDSITLASNAVIVEPAGAATGTQETDRVALASAPSDTADGSATVLTGTVVDTGDLLTAAIGVANVANGTTRYFHATVQAVVSNSLSLGTDSNPTHTVAAMASAMRVFTTMTALTLQDKIHLNYNDVTQADLVADNQYKGGIFYDKSQTAQSLSDSVGGGLQIDSSNDNIEVGASIPTVPTSGSFTVTSDDLQTDASGVDNEVTSSSMAVRFFEDPANATDSAFDDASPVTCLEMASGDSTQVELTTWYSYPFNYLNGHTDITDGVSASAQGTAARVSDTSATFTVYDATARTGFSESSGGAVVVGGAGDFNGTYSGHSYSGFVITLTGKSGAVLGGSLASATGVASVSDSSSPRNPLTVSIVDGNTLGNSATLATGFEYHIVYAGGSSVLRLRPLLTASDTYGTAAPVKLRLAWPAYSAATLVHANGDTLRGTGSSSASTQLWAAGNIDVDISFTSPTWNIGDYDVLPASNVRLTGDPNDASYTYMWGDYANGSADGTVAQMVDDQLLLMNIALDVDEIDVSEDAYKICVARVGVDGEGWDHANVTANLATIKAYTYAGVDAEALITATDGIVWYVGANVVTNAADDHVKTAHTPGSGETGLPNILESHTTGSAGYYSPPGVASGAFSSVSLRIDETSANATTTRSGDKFVVFLLTQMNCTKTDSATDASDTRERFMRRFEVRYAGGLRAFSIAALPSLSYPGSCSVSIDSVTVTDVDDNDGVTTPASYRWDYVLQAAINKWDSTGPLVSADTSAGNWQYSLHEVGGDSGVKTGQEYGGVSADDLQTRLRYLPDSVVVANGDGDNAANATQPTNTSAPLVDKSRYNTSDGLNYSADASSGNKDMYRIFYRLGLRRSSTAGALPAQASLADEDASYVYVKFNGTSRSADASTRVNTLGQSYLRFVSHDDEQTVSLCGMGQITFANSLGTDLNVYGFNNEAVSWDAVADNDVLSGSA